MEIVEKEALIVVGLPVTARWQDLWVEMPRAWRELLARHAEIEHPKGGIFVDVSLEKVGDQYLQLVGAQVSRVDQIPSGMRAIEIPAQQYVHHKHVGPVAGIAETFGKIYDWAQQNGHAAGDFKIDLGYTLQGDEIEHDLHVGLLPVRQWRDVRAT